MQEKGSGPDTVKQIIVHVAQKVLTLGMIMKPTMSNPIDMISMLSQITIKVPLSKLFRIDEHKRKALSWLEGIGNDSSVFETSPIQPLLIVEENKIISQTPQIFLDDSSIAYIEDIDPFFLVKS